MKTYKHIKTGELMTYKSGCMYVGKTVIEGTPDTNYWKKVVEIPVGTRICDTLTDEYLTKTEKGWENNIIVTIDESKIGEDKRFVVVEEPIEKHYEILSFVGMHGGEIYSRTKDGLFTNGGIVPSTAEVMLSKNRTNLIHSVKNNTGEILTIGDTVTNPAGLSFVISNFYFDSEGKKLLCNGKRTGNGHISINKVKKVTELKPDYKILSLRYTNYDIRPCEDVIVDYSGDVATNRSDGESVHNTVKLSEFTKEDWEKYITILKVKRLSDGEVFSVGDDIIFYNKKTKIKYIYYNEHKQLSFKVEGTTAPLVGVFANKNSHFRKTKLLFVTEDGVEIKEGDDYWVWDYGCLKGTTSEIHRVFKASQTHKGDGVDRKYFSTREVVEEYVILNKPCLSIQDIIDNEENNGNSNFDQSPMYRDLIEIVKSKL